MIIGENQYMIIPNSLKEGFEGRIQYIDDYAVILGDGCRSFAARNRDTCLLMIGYAIDSSTHQFEEDKICANLLQDYIQKKPLFESTRSLSGRWAIFIFSCNALLAFTDACAFRQVYYYCQDDYIAFASQARYLANVFGIKENEDALEYIELAKEQDTEYSWPLSSTRYIGIKRLLPNHIFDSKLKTANREFTLPLKYSGSYSQAAEEYARYLAESLRLLTKKGRAITTLTAGLDSRQILSCCESLKEKIQVITFCYKETPQNAFDVVIPARICERQGFDYQLIECEAASETFHNQYQKHCEDSHSYWEQIAQAIEEVGLKGCYLVKGSCNEIVNRCNGVLDNKVIDEMLLMKVFNIPFTKFSFQEITKWLQEARDYCRMRNMCLLDLFYWEHRMGSWCAASINETDLVCETFAPFNLRSYIEDIYQLPVSVTAPPKYLFFQELMRCNSPEYLKEPINNNRDFTLKRRVYYYIKYHCACLYRQLIYMKK